MNVWFQKPGRGLIAMLVFSQLFLAAHAAEHGAGPHAHGEIVCPYGLGNDDDPVIGSAVPQFFVLEYRQETTFVVLTASPDARSVALPPATGPPARD